MRAASWSDAQVTMMRRPTAASKASHTAPPADSARKLGVSPALQHGRTERFISRWEPKIELQQLWWSGLASGH